MQSTAGRRASYDLGGSVAVVTGGLKGIGKSIVDALERAGARVVIWDTAVDEGSGKAFKVDVSDIASVDRAASRTIEAEGKIDILVNNAGIAGSTHPVEAYDPMEWRRILDVNLTGTFNVCRRLVPAMKANGWGRIVGRLQRIQGRRDRADEGSGQGTRKHRSARECDRSRRRPDRIAGPDVAGACGDDAFEESDGALRRTCGGRGADAMALFRLVHLQHRGRVRPFWRQGDLLSQSVSP
jgi:hypothetical protein